MSCIFMIDAIEIAKKGYGLVYNRPYQGAIIVKNNEAISTGYSKSATINEGIIEAINKANTNLENSTMYINIEPFYDENNKTAVDKIIDSGIKNVVIGSYESNTSYKAVKILRENNVNVYDNCLDKECLKLNEVYYKYSKTNLPFVLLFYSISLDGKIATYINDSKNMKNEKTVKFINYMRNKVKCLLLGINYIIKNEHQYYDIKDKDIFILDCECKIPLDLRLINMEDKPNIHLIIGHNTSKDKINVLKAKNIDIITMHEIDNRIDLKLIMEKLGKSGFDSILIEGGSTLNFYAFESKIVDKIYANLSPIIIGGIKANSPIQGQGFDAIKNTPKIYNIQLIKFDSDIMFEGYMNSFQ